MFVTVELLQQAWEAPALTDIVLWNLLQVGAATVPGDHEPFTALKPHFSRLHSLWWQASSVKASGVTNVMLSWLTFHSRCLSGDETSRR